MKAVILAGGMGKRLRPLTDRYPKPLLQVSGVPIILWQLNWLKQNNITDVVMLVGYLKEKIINYVNYGSRFGMNIDFVLEKTPLGTGGALKNAKTKLEDEQKFVMINGDILTNLNLRKLFGRVDKEIKASIAVVPLQSSFGVIDIADDDKIQCFREKPLLDGYWMNAGVYCLSASIFDYLPDEGNIEATAFPKLAVEGDLKAVRYSDAFWISIDSHKDMESAARELKNDLDVVAKNYHLKRRKIYSE
jgi:NDP-sugar pyrophosphorylase family protein